MKNGKVILAADNKDEKIAALENEIAELKKQMNDLLLTFSTPKN